MPFKKKSQKSPMKENQKQNLEKKEIYAPKFHPNLGEVLWSLQYKNSYNIVKDIIRTFKRNRLRFFPTF